MLHFFYFISVYWQHNCNCKGFVIFVTQILPFFAKSILLAARGFFSGVYFPSAFLKAEIFRRRHSHLYDNIKHTS